MNLCFRMLHCIIRPANPPTTAHQPPHHAIVTLAPNNFALATVSVGLVHSTPRTTRAGLLGLLAGSISKCAHTFAWISPAYTVHSSTEKSGRGICDNMYKPCVHLVSGKRLRGLPSAQTTYYLTRSADMGSWHRHVPISAGNLR